MIRLSRWQVKQIVEAACQQGDRADLSGANPVGQSLIGADLNGADLRQADLSGVNLNGAKYDQDTKWP